MAMASSMAAATAEEYLELQAVDLHDRRGSSLGKGLIGTGLQKR
jgi:hypothetical protein